MSSNLTAPTSFSKEIDPQHIGEWIRGLAYSTRSNRNYYDVVRDIFRHAQQRKYVAASPLDEFSDDDRKELCGTVINGVEPPGILTVTEAERLLKAALANPDLDLLVPITMALFCGIRTEELTKLNWSQIKINPGNPGDSYVSIPASIAKKRRIRHVPIPSNALAWLMCCRKRKGPITRQDFATDFRKRFQRLLKTAGFCQTDKKGHKKIVWKRNAMRHSFGTYHFALHGNSLETARLLGHRTSDDILFAHYRDLTTKEEGEAYFGITPSKIRSKVVALPNVV